MTTKIIMESEKIQYNEFLCVLKRIAKLFVFWIAKKCQFDGKQQSVLKPFFKRFQQIFCFLLMKKYKLRKNSIQRISVSFTDISALFALLKIQKPCFELNQIPLFLKNKKLCKRPAKLHFCRFFYSMIFQVEVRESLCESAFVRILILLDYSLPCLACARTRFYSF